MMDTSNETNQSMLGYIQETSRKFLDRETSGGLLLILATIIALILGNSQWAEAYYHYLEDEFLFKFNGHFTFGLTVKEWINDGLMVIFFLVAGLELKREVLVGELSTLKKASMPILGAIGGMALPTLIFFSLNAGTKSISGWGIPMATDIAYSLGIIGLLGNRVPTQLKVFLVALAIADDLGAIMVIALFYSHNISWIYLGVGGGIFMFLLFLNRFGIKNLFWYILGGLGLWYCFLYSGVHPTIAGVLFAITIPFKPKLDSVSLKKRIAKSLKTLDEMNIEVQNPLKNRKQRKILHTLKKDANMSRPPLLKLENSLINFNTFFIIPVFAIANAGVKLDVSLTEVLSDSLGLGILLGLVVGKVFGISLFSYIGERMGFSELHNSLRWSHIIGMGMIAGIGFTMSLFITNLAFTDPELVKISKISILIASLIAAIGGLTTLLFIRSKKD